MKYTLTIIMASWIVLLSYAQEESITQYDGIQMATTTIDGTVRLRWSFEDYELWQLGNTYGYTITRQIAGREDGVIAQEGDPLTEVLISDYRALPAGYWGSVQDIDRDVVDLAEEMIYGTSMTHTVEGETTFRDAVLASQTNENLLFFAEMLAVRDFELAKHMGFAYTDETALAGFTYLYTVRINFPDGASIAKASNYGSIDISPQYPQPQGLAYEGRNKAISLSWSLREGADTYSHYRIERSSDNSTWLEVNEAPFVSFSTAGQAAAETTYFIDSVANNLDEYYYRIIGTTPFSIDGPPSEVIIAKGQADPFPIQLRIDSIRYHTGGAITLRWDGIPTAYAQLWKGFELSRSDTYDGIFTPVNQSPIGPTQRAYTDTDAKRYNFYRLSATDIYDNEYTSFVQLAEAPDTKPPIIPRGFEGTAAPSDQILLSWDANQEVDLMGYRVFRSFARTGVYVKISDGAIMDTSLLDILDTMILSDSAYYKIEAFDLSSNTSSFSEILAVPRYDNSPPIAPLLYRASAVQQGAVISWQWSPSTDVTHHEIQRKRAAYPGWETVETIPLYNNEQYDQEIDGMITAIYEDANLPTTDRYLYQVIAYDNSNLSTGSDILAVDPLPVVIKGEILDFSVSTTCQPVQLGGLRARPFIEQVDLSKTYFKSSGVFIPAEKEAIATTLDEEEFLDGMYTKTELMGMGDSSFFTLIRLIPNLADTMAQRPICDNTLQWRYAQLEGLESFKIYRSCDQHPMVLYTTIPIESLSNNGPALRAESEIPILLGWSDQEVRGNSRYTYRIFAQHSDGGGSKLSDTVSIVSE